MNKEQEILQQKLHTRIEKGLIESAPFIERIEKEGRMLNDFILPLGGSSHVHFFNEGIPNTDSTKFRVGLTTKEGKLRYDMHPHAVVQSAEKLGVNTSYIKNLVNSKELWKMELAAHNLNEHAVKGDRQRVLVREVGGEIRGVLTDMYRRLNSPLIFESFLKAATAAGAKVYSAFADATKSWIEVMLPTTFDIPTSKNGIVTIAYGMRISSSDFGDGALELRAFMLQVVCLNGMVRDSILKEIHLGRKIPDEIKMSEQTYLLDTQTQASLISDAVNHLMNRDSIMKASVVVQEASSIVVDFEAEFTKLARVNELSKKEIEKVKYVITNNRVEDGVQGENTLWKLCQGISAIGNQSDVDARRQKELAEISGKLLRRLNKVNVPEKLF